MDYQNDIDEIISFINEAISKSNNAYEECLYRFTADVDEIFLQERASAILGHIKADHELQQAFSRLASWCHGTDSECESCVVKKYCNTYNNMHKK